MIEKIISWLKSIFSDASGVPDEARVCAVALVFAYIILAGIDITFHHAHFDLQSFGVGAGALSAGVGGWFKLRGAE